MNFISEFENTLRRLVIGIIGSSDDSNYKVTTERVESWKRKREEENKKYKGLSTENRLIYYSEFYDLSTIIDKNWELFKPVFHDKKRFEVFFSEVEKFRNTVSHGRNLTLSQERLLEGITGELKNIITVYHNKNEMKEDYFMRIIRVSDNLGNVWEGPLSPSKPTLRVGDEYELNIEANDPKDRKIQYRVITTDGILMNYQFSNRFSFTIDKSLVGQSTSFFIEANTPSSDYNNSDGYVIRATVLPKIEQ